jgi:mono/diheme cytochrome c family protein
MKTTLFSAAILAVVALAMSCGSTPKAKTIFRPDALPSEWHNIDPDKDTTLVLESGMQIIIAAGSIQSSVKPAKMEIKQALKIEDILRAGLATLSDNSPLSSGGMMYLGFEDKNTKLAKPIRVKMPTTRIVEGMQQFKGELDKNGNLNWVEPKPLVEDEMAKERQKLAETKQLYIDYCASCHKIADPLLGEIPGPPQPQYSDIDDTTVVPAVAAFLIPLAHLYKYRGKEWLLTHIKTESTTFDNNDVHNTPECGSGRDFSRDPNKNPRNLSDEQLIRIFNYIEATSEAEGIPVPPYNAEICKAECAKKQQQYDALMLKVDTLSKISNDIQAKAGKKSAELTEKLQNVKDNMVSVTDGLPLINGTLPNPTPIPVPVPTPNTKKYDIVEATKRQSSYYCFDIEAPGYFTNIDLFLKGLVPDVNLVVTATAPRLDRIEVFLVVPADKIFIRGGAIDASQSKYVFFEKNGNVPIAKGRTAWIYAVGEEKGEFYLGLQSFTVVQDNMIGLKVEVSSQQKIDAALKTMSSDISLKVGESGRRVTDEIAAEIKVLDAEKEKIGGQITTITQAISNLRYDKPAACVCGCNIQGNPAEVIWGKIQ